VTLAPQPGGEYVGQADVCGIEEESCITCGDVALPLRVQSVDHDRMLALCIRDDGKSESVEIALVGDVAEGDELLVHAGTAIAHLDAVSGASA